MRNKIIALAAITLFVTSSAAFAVTDITMALDGAAGTANTGTGKQLWGAKSSASTLGASGSVAGLIGKTSTGVGVGAKTATTGYAVFTQHKSGSQEFGTASNTVTTYHTQVSTTGTPTQALPTSADSADFLAGNTNGWTSM